MRLLKPSPTGHLKGIRSIEYEPTPELEIVYNRLRQILSSFSDQFKVSKKSKWTYELWSHHGYRTKSNHPQNVRSVLFASLTVYEKHISLYYYPIYIRKELTQNLNDGLSHSLTGKSTFHFQSLSLEVEVALLDLLENGVDLYKEMRFI